MSKRRIPRPYVKLDKNTSAIYRRIWRAIPPEMDFEEIDVFHITTAAQSFAMAGDAWIKMFPPKGESEDGYLQTYKDGSVVQVNALYTVFNKMTAHGMKALKDAGLAFNDRYKYLEKADDNGKMPEIPESTVKHNPMADFLGLTQDKNVIN